MLAEAFQTLRGEHKQERHGDDSRGLRQAARQRRDERQAGSVCRALRAGRERLASSRLPPLEPHLQARFPLSRRVETNRELSSNWCDGGISLQAFSACVPYLDALADLQRCEKIAGSLDSRPCSLDCSHCVETGCTLRAGRERLPRWWLHTLELASPGALPAIPLFLPCLHFCVVPVTGRGQATSWKNTASSQGRS
jgi:hypothetical protein